jgi:hypothetical protein
VEEYFNELYVLATRATNISEKCLLNIAITGLKLEIQNQLKLLQSTDIEQPQKKAKIIEEKLWLDKQFRDPQSEKSSSKFIPHLRKPSSYKNKENR